MQIITTGPIASLTFAVAFATVLSAPQPAQAASATEIDTRTDAALDRFRADVGGAKRFLTDAEGVLVFPQVLKAGFGFGGEYGEGALRVKGKTVDYYSTIAGSFGFQIGAQSKTIILCFMTKAALDQFRNSEGWEVGVDGSVALVTLGVGDSVDTTNIKDPIVGFAFNNKGLMYNLTLEGSKMTRIKK
jgi:lipid-binding SYLF domain-containing protein